VVERRARVTSYIVFLLGFGLIVFLGHSPFLSLPYFWDELGQFVPSALDLYHAGALVPYSAVPNVHPPGVMAWLALVWKIAGYSIPATRVAMLLAAAAGVMFAFLLAIQLSRGLEGAPAFYAVLLLLLDPLVFTQSMLAQLDMPAMVFTLAGLLFFLQGRLRLAALACTALVLSKETGILLPFVCAVTLLLSKGEERQALWYAAPFIALTAWLALLWHTTGHLFGDPGFAHYNIAYSLEPVHAAASVIRRIYFLGFADFRWIGAIALAIGWRHGVFRGLGWRVTGVFAAAHIVLVSLLGGAELERYLLPVLPILYIAIAASLTALPRFWRNAGAVLLALGLFLGLFVNPPYPFPYENNLAVADFVELHHRAATYLEQFYAEQSIYTAWPLTAALRRPEFGYVHHGLKTVETSDLHESTLSRLDPAKVDVLVLYSRTWEPTWGVLRIEVVRDFLQRFYDYEPQMDAQQAREQLGLRQMIRYTRHGQWIAIYAKGAEGTVSPARR
jgi:4-amino-4-deoxy-L-arabinose transferase-like glycosyltransferase